MIRISQRISIPDDEIRVQAVRASGPGGQKVNKSSTAVHLFFDILQSSLPKFYKERLLALRDSRISDAGMVVIKAREHRTQEQNLEAARERLGQFVREAGAPVRVRKAPRPSAASRRKRTDSKVQRGRLKELRGRVGD